MRRERDKEFLLVIFCTMVFLMADFAVCFSEFAEGYEFVQAKLITLYTFLSLLFAVGGVMMIVEDVIESRKIRK